MAGCSHELLSYSRPPRGDCFVYQKARGSSAAGPWLYAASRDLDFVRTRTGSIPPIVDAKDVLENPERMLRLFCEAVGIEFSESMLSWPRGLRQTDGIWAGHWYGEVAKTTSFQPYRARQAKVPAHLREIYDRCRESYERLYEYRLR